MTVEFKIKNGEWHKFSHVKKLRQACNKKNDNKVEDIGVIDVIKKNYGEIELLYLDNVRVI